MCRTPHLRRAVAGVAAIILLVSAAGASARQARTVVLSIATNGIVNGAQGRLLCVARCSFPVRRGTFLTMRASHRPHFQFSHWAGGCVGSAPTCAVVLDTSQSVRAVYVGVEEDVSLAVGGPGTVVSRPAGLDCGGGHDACSATFPWGTTLKLIPSGASGGIFGRWGAACWRVAAGACTLAVTSDVLEVNAVFSHATSASDLQVLTIQMPAKSGQSLHVRSTPAGIDCPNLCEATFPAGARVVLTGSSYARWRGDCVAAATHCAVVVDAPATVAAAASPPMFTPPERSSGLGVSVTVAGKGTVTAPGIRCGGARGTLFDCENLFNYRQTIVLKAKPARRARFAGWKQFCSGKKPRCTLLVSVPGTTVGAVFRR